MPVLDWIGMSEILSDLELDPLVSEIAAQSHRLVIVAFLDGSIAVFHLEKNSEMKQLWYYYNSKTTALNRTKNLGIIFHSSTQIHMLWILV